MMNIGMFLLTIQADIRLLNMCIISQIASLLLYRVIKIIYGEN